MRAHHEKEREFTGSARFSPCERYRYSLTRRWEGPEARPLVFVLLNPSTADASDDDRTVKKCIEIARFNGRASLLIVNLFAFRATRRREALEAIDPVGPDNDAELSNTFATCAAGGDFAIAGWGEYGRKFDRDLSVWELARVQGCKLKCLRHTRNPWHPLYLSATSILKDWPPDGDRWR
jgi:hypothetical protein